MTRDEAHQVVVAFMQRTGVRGSGLNEKGFAGMMLGTAQIYFEYDEQARGLHCRAHIFSFRERPITPAEREEVWKAGADVSTLGGGQLEYMPENSGLFLTRSYLRLADTGAFADDTRQLAEASLVWRSKLLLKALQTANQKNASPPR